MSGRAPRRTSSSTCSPPSAAPPATPSTPIGATSTTISATWPRAGIAPADGRRGAVRGFLASLEERGLKASSAARRLSAVRQFHKFLYVEGYAPADPTAAVAAPEARAGAAEGPVGRRGRPAARGRPRGAPARPDGRAGRAPARGPHGVPARAPLRDGPARLRADRAAAQRRQDPRALPRRARQGRQGAPRAR